MRLRFELDTGKAEEQPPATSNHWTGPVQSNALPESAPPQIVADEDLKTTAGEKVREGRQKWLDGIKDEDTVANDRRNYWIGGAIAVYCAFTGEDPSIVHNRMLKEMPQPGHDNSMLAPGELPAQPIPRQRSEPHPGAQRIVAEDDPTMDAAESLIPEWNPETEEGTPPEILAGETEEDVDEDVRLAMLKGVQAASITDAPALPVRTKRAVPSEVSITKIEDLS